MGNHRNGSKLVVHAPLCSHRICWHSYDVIPRAAHHNCASISCMALGPMQQLIHGDVTQQGLEKLNNLTTQHFQRPSNHHDHERIREKWDRTLTLVMVERSVYNSAKQ